MGAGDSISSDNSLNRSLSTIVCLAYEHPSPAWRNNIPFCVADVDLDHDKDTTYQLIGFGKTCKQEGYKIQGYLTSQNVDKFLAAHKSEIENAQFREVDLISCAALGLEDNRRTDWLNAYIPLGVGAAVGAILLAKRLKDAAVVMGLLGATGTILWFLLEWHAEHLKGEQRYKRIQNLLSGAATAEKK